MQDQTFESKPGGCLMVLIVGVIILPMWIVPLGVASDALESGFRWSYVAVLAVDALAWIGLLVVAARGERLVFDARGIRWETWRAIGPLSTGPSLVRAASWPEIRARLVHELRTTKNGKPFEQRRIELTMPDAMHVIHEGAFKPWLDLVQALEARLGARFETIHDHGALGHAVQRLVDQRLGEPPTKPGGDVRLD